MRRPPPAPVASASRRAVLVTAGLLAAVPPPLPLAAVDTPPPPLTWRPVRSFARGALGQVYSPSFVAYFSRFLLNWEPVTARWWEQQKAIATTFDYDEKFVDDDSILGILGNAREELFLAKQFTSLVTSVEVSLEAFEEKRNATRLAQALSLRYTTPKQKYALAQLLSLLTPNDQPTALIAALIGEADNAKVTNVTLDEPGSTYGSTPPAIEVTRPPTNAAHTTSS